MARRRFGEEGGREVIDAIADRLAGVVASTRERIARTSEFDPVSEDLLITLAGILEKQLWMGPRAGPERGRPSASNKCRAMQRQAHVSDRHPLRHARQRVRAGLPRPPPGGQLRGLLDRRLPQYSDRTVVDADRYLARLAEVRQRGWASTTARLTGGDRPRRPVRDHRDEIVAAVLLLAPGCRVSGELVTEYGDAVGQAADEITARLRGRTSERIEAA